ncbi:MAG TPA: endonuclease/exonuclease/phosphatase family protein [Pyrinomonadaceae bacterium]
MRSNLRSRRGYISARVKPALFVAIIFAAALALTADFGRLVPAAHAIDRGTGSVSLTTLGTALTQNFNTLSNTAGSTTNEALPTGWYITESGGGARDNDQYAVDTGGSNTGDTFSYGAAGNTDRALGSLQSGTLISTFGAQFTNNTGATITSLDINYTGEQWRIGNTAAARDDRLDFQISTNATNLCGPDSGTCVGTYTDVNALDFTNPVKTATAAGALDGNSAANRTAISTTISSLSIPNGATFWVRWNDLNASGADDGLAVDDFSITPQGAGVATPTPNPLPALSVNDVSQDEGNAGSSNFTFTFTLSAPAGPGGVSFTASTSPGTATGSATSATEFDYTDTVLNLNIPEGQSSVTGDVPVRGDTTQEPNETFFVNITSASSGATIGDAQGQGTIVNDDFTILLISQIQGSTPTEDTDTASPRVGETVTVRGIVTLLKSNGFFLQEEAGDNDSDPNTSEGIFVFTTAAPTAALASQVTVTGTVVEFNGLTEISTTNANVITNNTGNDLSTATPPVTLTAADLPPTAARTQPQLEKYEGMRVSAASLTTVSPSNQFFEVYTVITGQPRPVREPGIPAGDPIPPDPTTGTPDCCIPIFDRNPERLLIDTNDRAGSTGEVFTSNVVITNFAGPLDFAFGAYRIVGEAAPTRTPNMSAVPVPTPFSTEFTVAGFNIENFNNNATQRQKASLAIVRVLRLPDIIGHAEITDLQDLEALADEVNADAVADGHPDPQYEARLIPSPVAGITQNVGYLVKTARVRIDAVTQERTASTYVRPSDGATDETHDRPPLVLRATVDPAGVARSVIVVVNHTRSFIEVELVTGDGPNARAKRKAQAEDLAGLFQELQTNNPGVPVIAVGDYNAFQFSSGYDDPIAVMKGSPTPDEQIVVDDSPDLVNPNFFNLIDELPTAEQYTFTFDNTPQALDHVLVNTTAHDINTRIAIARMNADFPEVPAAAFASDATRPERNSDHDAPVAYFTLFAEAQAGQLLISEFRHFGPGGAEDEFVEIYNNTGAEHVVAAADGSAGYSVATAANQTAGTTRCVIPNGTRIPARGYFLCANVDGYSLDLYPSGTARSAFPDAGGEFTDDIPVNAGLALFSTANAANFGTGTRLDAAGSVSETNALYKEGAGYPDITFVTTRQYSFFRDLRSGTPRDSNDNAADFLYVNTDGSDDGAGGRLGAPGPQNLASPAQRNEVIKASLIDPACSGVGTATANPVPGQSPDGTPANNTCQNTVRDTFPLTITQPNTSANGSFFIRRRFRNTTTQNVTRLRFRVVDITATPQTGTADLRLLSSGAVTYTTTGGEVVTVQGLTLEEPPAQALGGGFNSSVQCCADAPGVVGARTISLAEPLAPNGTIDLQFRFGVMAAGAYRFFVNVEAEFQPTVMLAAPSKAGASGSKRR